jgi:hypothetical protein
MAQGAVAGRVVLKQSGGNLSERLETVLDMMGFKEGKPKIIKEFIMKYWEDTPHVQNPFALFDLLTKVAGFGGALNANMVCGYVFGGPVGLEAVVGPA